MLLLVMVAMVSSPPFRSDDVLDSMAPWPAWLEQLEQELLAQPPKRDSPVPGIPLLLWWAPLQANGQDSQDSRKNDLPQTVLCPNSTTSPCQVTTNKWLLPASDAVLFYGTNWQFIGPDGRPDPAALPPRLPRQLWGLFHEESIANNYALTLPALRKLINISATFSRHADLPLTTQFLPSVTSLMASLQQPVSANSRPPPRPLAPVVYIQSDCTTLSFRDDYVRELAMYIAVDSYGACLHNREFPDPSLGHPEQMNAAELEQLVGQYPFTLAFENAICDDYITEKLWRTFRAGSIPIYRGSPSIRDYVPAGSVVVANDFESPRALATHLLTLAASPYALRALQAWRLELPQSLPAQLLTDLDTRPYRSWWSPSEDGKGLPDPLSAFLCRICESAHSNPTQSILHMHPQNLNCPPPVASTQENLGLITGLYTDRRQAAATVLAFWGLLEISKSV